MFLEKLFLEQACSSWLELVRDEFEKPYFVNLSKRVEDCANTIGILPDTQKIFRTFGFQDYKKIKAVVLGQDPYPNPEFADGMAFSASKADKIPLSLKNIYDEIDSSFNVKSRRLRDLSCWQRQGVLLANSALTIGADKKSHLGWGWQIWSDTLLSNFSMKMENAVFLLFGNYAISKRPLIASDRGHLILTAAHPSPLSAHRGFIGSQVFLKCNQFLQSNGREQIDWANQDII